MTTESNHDALAWPAIAHKEQVWEGHSAAMTRRERGLVGQRYQASVTARIAAVDVRLPGRLAADVEDATAAIARYDAELTPRTAVMAAVMIRSEAASSSQIEQLTASARKIAEAEVTGEESGSAAVVAANVAAMSRAIDLPGPVTTASLVQTQEMLLERANPRLVGLRTGPVWVGGSTPMAADFVGPPADRISGALADLEEFVGRSDVPILAQAAIAHAQFETIHPFEDGNGRTGRVMVHQILRHSELTRHVSVPVSAGLLVRKEAYFDALTAYRNGDAGPIIAEFTRAALHGVDHGRRFDSAVRAIQDEWRARVKARSDSSVWRLLDALPSRPVLDSEQAGQLLGIGLTNAYRPLRRLVDDGILATSKHHKSGRTLYRAPEILDALDDYAGDFGRRQ